MDNKLKDYIKDIQEGKLSIDLKDSNSEEIIQSGILLKIWPHDSWLLYLVSVDSELKFFQVKIKKGYYMKNSIHNNLLCCFSEFNSGNSIHINELIKLLLTPKTELFPIY
ncbi:MAG: hypothetical protein EKK64_11110 [Neisseriaceae bacterium]|nr:MAG: hypothetical protein EKK64_11110 [Neisseriaceae bacterium]